MNRLSTLARILSKPRFSVVFVAVALLLLAAYSISANLFVWGTLQFNPLGFEPLTVLFIILLAIGGGLLAAASLHYRSINRRTCAAGIAGGSLGLVASACPYCPPILAYFLGAQSLYFLSQYGMLFAAFAVLLVYYGLYKTLEVA